MFEIEEIEPFENALRNGKTGDMYVLISNSVLKFKAQINNSELNFTESESALRKAVTKRNLSKAAYNSILCRLLDIGSMENIKKFYNSIKLTQEDISQKKKTEYNKFIESILSLRKNLNPSEVFMHSNWAIINWEVDIKEKERIIYADKVILNVKEIVKDNPKASALSLLVVLALFFSKQLPNSYSTQDKNIDYPSVKPIANTAKAIKEEDSSSVKDQKKYSMDVKIKVEGNGKVGEIININGAKEVNL